MALQTKKLNITAESLEDRVSQLNEEGELPQENVINLDTRLGDIEEDLSNINTGHDHNGANSKKVDHVNLLNKGTNTHAQIDSHIASTANPHSTTKTQVGLGNVDNTSDANKPISTAQAAVNALKADLVGGKVPSSQLPTYVDDVLEYDNFAAFPASGEAGKIYVAKDTNLTYRWSGSAYVEISKSLALGETSATAYRGDRGKEAYDHTLRTDNPHGTTKSHVGLGNVDNTSDANKPISTAQQTAMEANELTEAEAIVKLFKEVDGIKTLLAKMVTGEAWIDKLLVMSELNLFGSTNMIIKATTAPIPDFIGQFFINTTSAPYVGYIAIGTSSVSDWKQITN